jgi:site-specific DNA recombinase
VRRTLHGGHAAGINVHHGQEIGVGKWPAIITRAQWDFTQELLTFRSTAAHENPRTLRRRPGVFFAF